MQLLALLSGHEDDVEMAAFSPDGNRVATASRDHSIGVFGVDGNLQLRMTGHRSDVIAVEWARNGAELISTGDDGTVRRWSAESGQIVDVLELGGETDTVVVVDDNHLFAGNDEGDILAISGGEVRRVSAHQAGIKRLAYDAANRRLVSLSYDKTMRIWSVPMDGCLNPLYEADVPNKVWLRSCCFAGQDELAFTTFGTSYATFSLSQREWNVRGVEDTGGLNAVRVAAGSVYSVGDAGAVLRDGAVMSQMGSLCNFLGEIGPVVVTGGQKGVLFDAHTGGEIYRHHSPLNCCTTFGKEGKQHLAVGTYTGEVLVFALAGDRLIYTSTIVMHENAIKGLASNGPVLFGVCATGAAAFHSTESFARLRFVPDGHRKISNGAAVLPDGRFVSVSRDLSLRIWSLTGVEERPTPHRHSVKCVAASPNGRLVATGSYDGSVALFDWRRGTWIGTERPSAAGISSLTCGFQDDRFLASSYDGGIYDVAARQPGESS